jgi:hypothetical protein
MLRRRGFGGKAPKQLAKLSKDVMLWSCNCTCAHGHYIFVMTRCYLDEFYGIRFGAMYLFMQLGKYTSFQRVGIGAL